MAQAERTTRKSTKGGQTRQRIIDQALHIAGRVGLEGVTIGELAGELGLSKSGLFAHFKSKERLQLEVLDAAAEQFALAVFVPALKKPRGVLRLQAIFDNWLQWIDSEEPPGGCIFLASATEWDDREGPVREALVQWFEQLEAGQVRAVGLALTTGEFRKELDCSLFAAEMHGIVLKYHLEARLMRRDRGLAQARAAFGRLLADAQNTTGEGDE